MGFFNCDLEWISTDLDLSRPEISNEISAALYMRRSRLVSISKGVLASWSQSYQVARDENEMHL